MRRVFDVAEEPRGEVLHRVIRSLAGQSFSIMLVLRADFGLGEKGRALLSRLEPHLVEREQSAAWPGTVLLDGEATVLRFAPRETVIDEVIAASDALYAWRQPELPEDLALMRDDGSALLASIAHEHDAYLELTDDEYESLPRAAPDFAKMLRPHQGG